MRQTERSQAQGEAGLTCVTLSQESTGGANKETRTQPEPNTREQAAHRDRILNRLSLV